jgi:hypothetical protein
MRLNESNVPIPRNHVIKPILTLASTLLIEYLSIKKLIAGSMSEIDDVIAAKNNRINNKVARILPPGIDPNAIGSVSKMSPGPAVDGSRL